MVQKVLEVYKKVTSVFYSNTDKDDSDELLGWMSRESQFKRFEVLVELAQKELDLKMGNTVIDVGCGYAALFEYMCQEKLQYQYTGIDSNPQYIKKVKKRFPDAYFSVFDILKSDVTVLPNSYDVVFLSGVWNLDASNYFKDPEEKVIAKYAVIEFALSIMCKSAKKGVVCNFLHTDSKYKYSIFNYHNPETLITYLQSKNFKIKSFKEKYLDNDFSVVFLPLP